MKNWITLVVDSSEIFSLLSTGILGFTCALMYDIEALLLALRYKFTRYLYIVDCCRFFFSQAGESTSLDSTLVR